jgi:RluA family pseudouridine synthase
MQSIPNEICILYEDDGILAVNKPEGITTIPERDTNKKSLLQILQTRYGEKLFVIHRLDKDASGAMLFAKTADMHRYMSIQFERREVEKTYEALVHGNVVQDAGSMDQSLRAFGSGRMGADTERGKPSLTLYRVLKRLSFHTLLEVYPQTGRRHQIRVHLYGLGHPIAGDALYGDRKTQKDYPRLMLHAKRLRWQTPSGEERIVEAGLPESFKNVISMLSKEKE